MAGIVNAGHFRAATLAIEEVDCLQDCDAPHICADVKWPRGSAIHPNRVWARLPYFSEIQEIERADAGLRLLHGFRQNDFTCLHVDDLKFSSGRAGGKRGFRSVGEVAGMAVGDSPGGHFPAFEMVGLHFLQFETVDIITDGRRRTGLIALKAVRELHAGDFVPAQMGNLPHDMVPPVRLQQDEVAAVAVVHPRHLLPALVVKNCTHRNHSKAGQRRVHPERETVERRPVFAVELSEGRRDTERSSQCPARFVADGGRGQSKRPAAGFGTVGRQAHRAEAVVRPVVQVLHIVEQPVGQYRLAEPAVSDRVFERDLHRHARNGQGRRFRRRSRHRTDNHGSNERVVCAISHVSSRPDTRNRMTPRQISTAHRPFGKSKQTVVPLPS